MTWGNIRCYEMLKKTWQNIWQLTNLSYSWNSGTIFVIVIMWRFSHKLIKSVQQINQIQIMANRKFNDFLNNTMEIIINAVKKVASTTDKFFKTKKTIRKWMSITFISMLILESFFPLGKIVKGLVGNFVGGASGVVIFIIGFLATCYIVVEATDPANGKNNK